MCRCANYRQPSVDDDDTCTLGGTCANPHNDACPHYEGCGL